MEAARFDDCADVADVETEPGAAPPRTRPESRLPARAALDTLGGLVGALPVLSVIGAVPWRTPTLLVELMFTGFTRCALGEGSLTPLVMRCDRVGAPLGMHQLDGALSYPWGGLLMQLGLPPSIAWKVSVATLIICGFVALFHFGRRVTGSVPIALLLVVATGYSHTLTARSWNWYWNATAVSLLPLVLLSVVMLLDRARTRRLAPVVPPAAALLVSVVLATLEWSYAGMFAAAVAATAVVALILQPAWHPVRRLLLLAGSLVGATALFAMQDARLHIAGVHTQWGTSFELASEHAVDVAALVLPDPHASYLGQFMDRVGFGDLLVPSVSSGRQLWVAPYLGVVTVGILAGTWAARRGRLTPNRHCPPGVLPVLLAVNLGAIALSLGPVVQVAGLALPDATYVAWTSWLWRNTPMEWIRFPWTWAFLTRVTLLATVAVLIPRLFRTSTSWSPAVWLLAGVVVLEFASPTVVDAIGGTRPSVATIPAVIGSNDPDIADVDESQRLAALHQALRRIDGTITVLPWDNTLVAPYLSPRGARLRNVGIDRNFVRSTQLAPIAARHLRRSDAMTVELLLDSGWADAVVLLDRPPQPYPILERHSSSVPVRARLRNAMRRMASESGQAGACVRRGPWFWVVTACPSHGPTGAAEAL